MVTFQSVDWPSSSASTTSVFCEISEPSVRAMKRTSTSKDWSRPEVLVMRPEACGPRAGLTVHSGPVSW